MADRSADRAREIISRLTEEEKLGMLTTHHAAVERLGLDEFYIGSEVARGFVGRDKDKISTVFPQPVGLASTFDKELLERLGRIAGDEARAYYNDEGKTYLCLWGPTIDPVRDPRWGRTEEAYGEDVFLAGELAQAYTLGMADEKDGYVKIVPTLKHFCANNNEQDRSRDDSRFDMRQKFEYYYAPFENAIVNGGARSVMASYNRVNGVPSVCNPDLEKILKERWGLWFTVSDGGGFSQIYETHRYTDSHSETFAEAVKAGCDCMTDNETLVRNAARRALDEGKITWEEIDKTLFNTLYARLRLGQYDENCPYNGISKDIIDCAEHKAVNRTSAMEQVCLLKNDGLLPLKTSPKSIAVVGALADENHMDWYTGYSSGDISVLEGVRREFADSRVSFDSLWDIIAVKAPNGKYLSAKEDGTVAADSDSAGESELFELQDWGGNWNCLFSVKYKRYVRLSDGCLKLHGRRIFDWFTHETFNILPSRSGKVILEEFLFHKRLCADESGKVISSDIKCECADVLFEIRTVSSAKERAEKLAKENELVIYCVGNHPLQTAKECYDRKTLALNVQTGMALTLQKNNPDTVMALISSYPYSITAEDKALSAVIYSSHAGAFLGEAIACTISGKNNPSARLPLTWYAGDNDLHDIKDYDIVKNQATYMYFKGEPLYPFGHGLSYSEFCYGIPKAQKTADGVSITVDVTNTSELDGVEVVQVYYTLPDSQVSRPIKKLCGFERVFIPSGQTVSAKVDIPQYALRIFDVRSGKMIVESGNYHFFTAQSSRKTTGECVFEIEGERLAKRAESFEAQSFDSAENVDISYSKRLHRHYIKAAGWSGSAVFGGLDLKDKTSIIISASASVTPAKVSVYFKNGSSEITVMPSDARDDFKEYELPVPQAAQQDDSLTIVMSEGAGLLDISIAK